MAWLTNTFQRYQVAQDQEISDLLAERVQYLVDPKGVLNTAGILQWSHWDKFEDAIIVRVPSLDQPYRRQAAYLNPGRRHIWTKSLLLRDLTTLRALQRRRSS